MLCRSQDLNEMLFELTLLISNKIFCSNSILYTICLSFNRSQPEREERYSFGLWIVDFAWAPSYCTQVLVLYFYTKLMFYNVNNFAIYEPVFYALTHF